VRYAGIRLSSGLVTLLGMSLIIFLVMRLLGDPLALYLPVTATNAQRAIARHALGLDQPLVFQYFEFIGNAVRGNLGTSIVSGLAVTSLIGGALVEDVKLVLFAFAIALPAGVSLGVLAASSARRGWQRVANGIALIGQSIPSFWLGIMLILVFGAVLRILPAGGDTGFESLVLPGVTLAIFPMAGWIRLTMAAMRQILQSDYVLFERVSGIPERRIIWKYALKNAAIPILSFTGLVLGPTIGGAVVVETVFSWPGIARMAVEAITTRDYALMQGIALVLTAIVVVVNVLVDLGYLLVDPRLRRA
jgi:peptide/nickel transport system permease protein